MFIYYDDLLYTLEDDDDHDDLCFCVSLALGPPYNRAEPNSSTG